MCVLCVEYQKGKMSTKELLSNAGEMINSESDEEKKAHLFGLVEKVISKDMPFDSWENDSVFGVLDELDYDFMPPEDGDEN